MDTIMIIRDSVVCCVRKTAEICQPCVKEAGANDNDMIIVAIICGTIIVIAIVAIMRFFKWKDDERKALQNAAKKKREHEVEDREFRMNVDRQAHEQKRKENQEDNDQKRKEESLDHALMRREEFENKLLGRLESQIESGEAVAEKDEYIEMLKGMIGQFEK